MERDDLVSWSEDEEIEGGIFKNTPEVAKDCHRSYRHRDSSQGLSRTSLVVDTGSHLCLNVGVGSDNGGVKGLTKVTTGIIPDPPLAVTLPIATDNVILGKDDYSQGDGLKAYTRRKRSKAYLRHPRRNYLTLSGKRSISKGYKVYWNLPWWGVWRTLR